MKREAANAIEEVKNILPTWSRKAAVTASELKMTTQAGTVTGTYSDGTLQILPHKATQITFEATGVTASVTTPVSLSGLGTVWVRSTIKFDHLKFVQYIIPSLYGGKNTPGGVPAEPPSVTTRALLSPGKARGEMPDGVTRCLMYSGVSLSFAENIGPRSMVTSDRSNGSTVP